MSNYFRSITFKRHGKDHLRGKFGEVGPKLLAVEKICCVSCHSRSSFRVQSLKPARPIQVPSNSCLKEDSDGDTSDGRGNMKFSQRDEE
ncbi:hypothetical protein RvY_07370 [Ramazzottius varieornatus]|uniref:Uncharacterized protein n=1 Tax=Ramazzottius varieornatus TaxID=947166 RepID=A0A1D1V240_RAMVA|nr:hypothetical protein RvY_07370 [Ramazzottius varieornatus]